MTRIIALSDTHLQDDGILPAVAKLAKDADIILHAGDFVSAEC
jgi:predicted phosphodiesterase